MFYVSLFVVKAAHIRNLHRLVNIMGGTSLYALVCLACDIRADNLYCLNYYYHQQHAGPGDIAVASLVAVDNSNLAEAGSAGRKLAAGHLHYAGQRSAGLSRPYFP